MNKIEIIEYFYQYNLRHNTGIYTFSFIEDNFEIIYHSHSTGQHLTIYLINKLDNCKSKLLIYREDKWKYYHCKFNNNNTIQGYQHFNEPWIEVCEELFDLFNNEIKIHKEQLLRQKINTMQKERENEQSKLQKFRKMFT